MSDKKLPIIEIFGPTVQGEGKLIGHRCHFIRLGGCPYRCNWCDTMYAVLPEEVHKNATRMTPAQILDAVAELPPAPWMSLSGGDPVMHDLSTLIDGILAFEMQIAVETQASLYRSWLENVNLVTVSPKPPSSGESPDYAVLDHYMHNLSLGVDVYCKVVVNHDFAGDLEFAQSIHERYPEIPMSISMCTTPTELISEEMFCWKFRKLVERVLTIPELQNVQVLPQMHVLIWGDEKGR